MRPHLNAIIILLVALLLLVLNETIMPGEIPPWIFIVLLVIWIIVRFGSRLWKK